MRLVLGLALALVGCAASLSDPQGGSNNNGTPDASTGGDDAGGGSDSGVPSDAAPVCAEARSIYLNFDGQALTQAAASDATQNQAGWMNKPNGSAPPFRQGSANRNTDITAITSGITAALAQFPNVTVVTTRPATGPYMMIVFGGTAAQVGSNFGGAVQKLDCGNTVKSDVAWVGDGVTPNQRTVNFALGAIGFGLGLTATTNSNDCMCGWDNDCQQTTAQCTFSANINRDGNANQTCPNVTTQNEQQTIMQGFCP